MTKSALTWDNIIDELGGTGSVSRELDQLKSVVSGWRTRGIPSWHWPALVRFAAKRGKRSITLEVLADLAAARFAEARA